MAAGRPGSKITIRGGLSQAADNPQNDGPSDTASRTQRGAVIASDYAGSESRTRGAPTRDFKG